MKISFNPVSVVIVSCLMAVLVFSAGCGRKTSVPASQISGGPAKQASLAELNEALEEIVVHTGVRSPTTNELAAYLANSGKAFPVPPPGQKLVLNPDTRKFEMVDE